MISKVFNFRDFDWPLFGLAVLIAVIGVVEIYSTTSHSAVLAAQFKKQIYWIILASAIALVVSRLDYHVILEQVPWVYGLSILALVVLLVKGHSVAGVRRWVSLGVVTFQVSEFVKLVIILLVAVLLAENRGKTLAWRDLIKLGVLVGIPAILVALEPDLGTALTFFPIAAAGVLLAGIRFRQVAVICLSGMLMLPVAWHFARPYQRERVLSFVHPKQDTRGSSYQSTQSKIAIGSGGLWGKGIGNGTQSQLGFIPVSHADFIFAAFSEEQGFAGTLLVLLLYLALLLRLLDSAQMAGDRAGTLVLVGFAALLFFQVAVNVGMMIGLFPVTGIPLPLMSQGGSSVLSTFLGLGLAMSVRMRRLVY